MEKKTYKDIPEAIYNYLEAKHEKVKGFPGKSGTRIPVPYY